MVKRRRFRFPPPYRFLAPNWVWRDPGWGPRKKHVYVPLEEVPAPITHEYDPEDDPLVALVQEALTCLTDKQRYVICRYFGLGCPQSTDQEIADTMGVTRVAALRIRRRGCQSLRGVTILQSIL